MSLGEPQKCDLIKCSLNEKDCSKTLEQRCQGKVSHYYIKVKRYNYLIINTNINSIQLTHKHKYYKNGI